MAQIVPFARSDVETYEVQAALLALLAWPEHEPGNPKHSEAQVALVGRMFRAAAAADPVFAHNRLPNFRPVYLLMGENETMTLAARTYERLRRSMVAVRILRPFVQRQIFGDEAPPLPADLSRLSLNAVTAWVLERMADARDPHTFEEKVVRKLFPVLHLGIALELVLQKAEKLVGCVPPAEFVMTTPALTEDMVRLAEELESAVLGIEAFRVVEEEQVRIRLLG